MREKFLFISFTDPPTLFFPQLVKKNQNEEKILEILQ